MDALFSQLQDRLNRMEGSKRKAATVQKEISRVQDALGSLSQALDEFVGVDTLVQDNANKPSLRESINLILANANQPLTAGEVTDTLIDGGYKYSKKTNLRSMVHSCLKDCVDDFRRSTHAKTRPARFALRHSK